MNTYEGYKIVQAEGNNSRYKEIKPDGRGSIPVVLLGLYTTAAEAKKAIDTQQAESKQKVKSNATKQSNG
tara:strand:- start:3114 stop:3323 length:210 start_codon:yes stop_codon:yes gene_type:complete